MVVGAKSIRPNSIQPALTPRHLTDGATVKIAIFGAGLVGQRTARALVDADCGDIVLVAQSRTPPSCPGATVAQGWPTAAAQDADIVVLATASHHQPAHAKQLVRAGVHVVTTADNPGDVQQIIALDAEAYNAGVILVAGAAYSPGISTLLASYLAQGMDSVNSIRTARFGTGGPACAREHHRAMGASGQEIHDGRPRVARGGTGRELVWFPDPVGAADCYRGGLGDPLVLRRTFPRVDRIESRQAATRRDRLTARLPMLRPPHAEGLVGAVWAEVRGSVGERVEHRALAATAPQATGAAAMAAAFCRVIAGQIAHGAADPVLEYRLQSAAELGISVSLMQLVSKDVRLWAYDGSQIVTTSNNIGPIHAARKWRIAAEIVAIPTIFR